MCVTELVLYLRVGSMGIRALVWVQIFSTSGMISFSVILSITQCTGHHCVLLTVLFCFRDLD